MAISNFKVTKGIDIGSQASIITTTTQPTENEPIATIAIGAKNSEVAGHVYIKSVEGVGGDKWLRVLQASDFTDILGLVNNLEADLDDLSTIASGHTTSITALTNQINAIDAVVGSQDTGWTGISGTGQRTGYTTYTAPNIGILVDVAEVQEIADHLQALSRTVKSISDAMFNHGLIGT